MSCLMCCDVLMLNWDITWKQKNMLLVVILVLLVTLTTEFPVNFTSEQPVQLTTELPNNNKETLNNECHNVRDDERKRIERGYDGNEDSKINVKILVDLELIC